MNTRERIKNLILASAQKNFGKLGAVEFSVEVPKDIAHGDYSVGLALALSKKLGKDPMEVAQKIAARMQNKMFEKVEIAKPGFINFYLTKDFFADELAEVLKNKKFGSSQDLLVRQGFFSAPKKQKVMVEYTDPNLLKEFHIGHLMSNAIGESLSRIYEFRGAEVKRACYQSDASLGIAKAVFGKMRDQSLSWQNAYVLGTELYEVDENAKKEITVLNKKIFTKSDKAVNKVYDEGKKWSLEYFEAIYKKLGTKFDYYFLESEAAGFGRKTVLQGLKKHIFEKGENGAIIFKGEKFGLHTRVFINAEGLPTYEAKELALAKIKYDKYKYDESVVITGNEINEYFKVLMCAMLQIFPDLQEKTTHIGHGMMRLPDGKMSSRTGKVITFEALLAEVEAMVLEKIATRDFSDSEKSRVARTVAIGALKYSILKQGAGGDIVYDSEKSISFQGDSGPYLQYALVRASAVLQKAGEEKIQASLKKTPEKTDALVKMMHYFPEAVQKAGRELSPHYVVTYLTELAREFNNYYSQNKIVDRADTLSPYKLAVTEAFARIMKNGLWLLGIPAPDKM